MASKRFNNFEKSQPGEITIATTFAKAFKAKSVWSDKDEFLDVVYWMRQAIGLACGLLWGLLAMKGIFAIIVFLVLNALAVYVYHSTFQTIDEEEFGGVTEILKEGLMTSFATFLVSWIILYSALHFD